MYYNDDQSDIIGMTKREDLLLLSDIYFYESISGRLRGHFAFYLATRVSDDLALPRSKVKVGIR